MGPSFFLFVMYSVPDDSVSSSLTQIMNKALKRAFSRS